MLKSESVDVNYPKRSMPRQLKPDVQYVCDRSLVLDLKFLRQTATTLLRRDRRGGWSRVGQTLRQVDTTGHAGDKRLILPLMPSGTGRARYLDTRARA
ncbi:MAG TPA: hypothetical protein VMW58_05570 [Anaerolineae bacterium]|nr:hypothetical protein [Anaerolineae bacterium]